MSINESVIVIQINFWITDLLNIGSQYCSGCLYYIRNVEIKVEMLCDLTSNELEPLKLDAHNNGKFWKTPHVRNVTFRILSNGVQFVLKCWMKKPHIFGAKVAAQHRQSTAILLACVICYLINKIKAFCLIMRDNKLKSI